MNKKLADYFRSIAPSLAPLQTELAKLEKVQPKLTAVPILQELDNTKKRKTTILVKGNFLTPEPRLMLVFPLHFIPLKPTVNPTDSTSQSGLSTPITHSPPESKPTVFGALSSAEVSLNPKKTSAPKARFPPTPNSLISLHSNSSIQAGISKQCSNSS